MEEDKAVFAIFIVGVVVFTVLSAYSLSVGMVVPVLLGLVVIVFVGLFFPALRFLLER